jgi:hypothetical protein
MTHINLLGTLVMHVLFTLLLYMFPLLLFLFIFLLLCLVSASCHAPMEQ